jgi:hypothetical protein
MPAQLGKLQLRRRPSDVGPLDSWRPTSLWLGYLPIPVVAFTYLFFVLVNGGPIFFRLDPAAYLFDAGIQVTGAVRILNGGVLYRDWWAYYAPGQYYTLAGLFALFGASIEVMKLWDFATRALLSVAVFFFAAKLTSFKAGLIPFIVVVLWLASCGFYGYVMFPALSLALISMIWLLKYFHSEGPIWLIASGAMLGAATIYRHDVGVYAGICQTLTLAIFWLVDPGQRANGVANKLVQLGRAAGVLAVAFTLPVLPVAIYFLRSVPLDELFYNFIVFPLTVFPGSWSLPLPPLVPNLTLFFTGKIPVSDFLVFLVFVWVPFYFPLLVYVLGLTVACILLIRPRVAQNTGPDLWGLLLLTLFGIALFNQVINRADWIHQLPTSIMSVMLLSTFYYHALRMPWAHRIIARMLLLLVLVPISWATRALIVPLLLVTTTLLPSPRASDAGQTPRGQAEAIQFIQERVTDSERIFVGNVRHDISASNDAMFYFLSRRQNATRYDDLLAARVNRMVVQEEIIESLHTNMVNYIVLFSGFYYGEPNQSSMSSEVTLLDEFIRETYTLAAEYGDYTVWVKR